MAKLSVTVEPFEVPETVDVSIGSNTMEVPLEELDEETLATLIEEFTTAVMAKAGK